ncbi:3-oxoacyl-(acyl carrier protein) synthase II [Catenovulum agarivorans DS-2]|uniref:3-oxoacyl-(Acyl carrier protein) synthase II n=1 Tax=Catenovulum agarivorans DS-2 TaxID=1328313 RepID=W7QZ30_9ALTE|nr:beta-ketoacyl-ACP synthase [Catenovulum agarivorans]EWH10605.1 3-oxoacyl-(acyl carrier protein) synthase II [Catenovulum agarivorans DS-2]
MKRVVVTGMSAITALGDDWQTFQANLKLGKNAVVQMQEWQDINGLHTALAAPVAHFKKPKHYSRKATRSMGRVSLMSTRTTELALEQAQLLGDEYIKQGQVGIAYGSSIGSTPPIVGFGDLLKSHDMSGITATSYIQMMNHTTAVNVGVFFGLKGRIYPTSSACTSGSQAIGYAYEAIKFGRQKVMVAGGAEELCLSEVAVFDTLFATSSKNDTPELTPRPFDEERDGLVIGEGACTLILEELEHAQARGANILAEIIGFGSNSDGVHVTQPEDDTMAIAMQLALDDANVPADKIGYVSAHGTATDKGDVAESNATERVLGKGKPISSLKGYLGHTLGACGAIEAWASIEMMNANWFAPNINLAKVDSRCGDLTYISGQGLELNTDYIMSNNFAFGGINTSIIFKRWQG